ncbi:MAG: class I SAM-dependent RNA methyltransferase [Clostridia bacterium]|nr:class I SAM-dependent RNA methyltransferase [Clostridia bacterium]
MKLLIPAAFGLEAVVKRQLKAMGYEKAPAENGRIAVEGGWDDVARINMFIRSGERVLIEVGRFDAKTFDELFDGTLAVPWEDYLQKDSAIFMEGKSAKSALGAVKAAGSVVKKAIVTRLCEKFGLRVLPEDGPRTIVGVSIFRDEVTLTLDTSGEGLHKRGYRCLPYDAPLKETLAAALIDMTYYFPEKPFADIFCGSGTLPIEAAMRSLSVAPGKSRDFDFMHWRVADTSAHGRALEEALDKETPERKVDIYGADINPRAVETAKIHAARAGVGKAVRFETADMRRFSSDVKRGVLVSNPPYGQRMESVEEAKRLMADFGKVVRALPDWNAYVLTSLEGFERFFEKRADARKKLYNANIECVYYSYLSTKPERRDHDDV